MCILILHIRYRITTFSSWNRANSLVVVWQLNEIGIFNTIATLLPFFSVLFTRETPQCLEAIQKDQLKRSISIFFFLNWQTWLKCRCDGCTNYWQEAVRM